MESKDYKLVMGYIGFASITGNAAVDNVKIWAPTVITEKAAIFTNN